MVNKILNIIGVLALILIVLAIYDRVRTEQSNRIYVFNLIKYKNATKKILQRDGSDDSIVFATSNNQRLSQVIKDVAGNNLVVIRQAVLSGNYVDITDTVLNKLGLPTDVNDNVNLGSYKNNTGISNHINNQAYIQLLKKYKKTDSKNEKIEDRLP